MATINQIKVKGVTYDLEGSPYDDKTRIQFSIGKVTYNGIEGDTWTTWINSKFNTDGFKIEGQAIKSKDGLKTVTGATPSAQIYNLKAFLIA